MAFYGYRAAAFGPLSGFGGYELDIVGGMRFDEPWSANDWRDQRWSGYTAYEYAPLAQATIELARQKWQQMQEHVDLDSPLKADYQNKMSWYRSNIQGWAQIIDGNTRAKNYGGSPDYPGTRTRVLYLNEINRLMREISELNISDPYEEISRSQAAAEAQAAADAAALKAAQAKTVAAQAKAAADAAASAAALHQTQSAVDQAKAAIAAANQAKAVAQASAQKNRELQALAVQKSAMTTQRLPLILGGLAALTAGAVYLARRKR